MVFRIISPTSSMLAKQVVHIDRPSLLQSSSELLVQVDVYVVKSSKVIWGRCDRVMYAVTVRAVSGRQSSRARC